MQRHSSTKGFAKTFLNNIPQFLFDSISSFLLQVLCSSFSFVIKIVFTSNPQISIWSSILRQSWSIAIQISLCLLHNPNPQIRVSNLREDELGGKMVFAHLYETLGDILVRSHKLLIICKCGKCNKLLL